MEQFLKSLTMVFSSASKRLDWSSILCTVQSYFSFSATARTRQRLRSLKVFKTLFYPSTCSRSISQHSEKSIFLCRRSRWILQLSRWKAMEKLIEGCWLRWVNFSGWLERLTSSRWNLIHSIPQCISTIAIYLIVLVQFKLTLVSRQKFAESHELASNDRLT